MMNFKLTRNFSSFAKWNMHTHTHIYIYIYIYMYIPPLTKYVKYLFIFPS